MTHFADFVERAPITLGTAPPAATRPDGPMIDTR